MFFSSAREIFLPEISFCAEKISLTRSFCLQFVPKMIFADVEKKKAGVFSSNHRRSNIKTRKVLPKYKHKDEKTQGHHGKAKGQNQKASVLHRKDQAQASKTSWFLPLPHSVQKIQADFLSKLLHFSRLPPLFYLKPPYPVQNPIQSYAQDTRLRVHTRSRSQRICHFCLHPSPHPATNCRSIGCV